jgi:ketosteroid isomerase-like protein
VSQENVDVVEAFFEAWNAGDMTAVRELYHPDVVARSAEGWPEQRPFVGRDVVMRWFQQLREAWDDEDSVLPESEFTDGADHVAVRYVWRGVRAGPDMELRGTVVFSVRNRTIIGHEFFWDHAEALKAVGLEE